MTPGPGIEPGTRMVGGERSHHCAILAAPSPLLGNRPGGELLYKN